MSDNITKIFFQCPACGKRFDENEPHECGHGYQGELVKRSEEILPEVKKKKGKND